MSLCPTGYLRNHTYDIYQFLCMLPISVARSSSGMFTIGRIACRREGIFFPTDNAYYNGLAAKGIIRSSLTSCSTRDHSVAAAFAENEIDREGGDGSAQHGRSVIYDCLVMAALRSRCGHYIFIRNSF